MTRAELWALYTARNPAFAGSGNVTLSAAGLRKLFEQTWGHAEAHGRERAEASARFNDVFGEMFGGKKRA